MNTKIIATIFAIVVIVSLAYVITQRQKTIAEINSFEDCVAAGFPIMESFPPRCITADGRNFTQATSTTIAPPATTTGTTTPITKP